MITLVHTGLQVPTDSIRVTGRVPIESPSGRVWVVLLRDGTARLGRFIDDRGRSEYYFEPETSATQRVFDEFVAQCRDPDGAGLPADNVVTALANEWAFARSVAEAEAEGRYVMRGFDDRGVPHLARFALAAAKPPDYTSGLEAAGRMPIPAPVVRAELWMGAARGWVEIFGTPDL